MPPPRASGARVVVVGLGPGRPGLITAETAAAVAAMPVRWVRTSRHPCASALPEARTFDYLYDSAASLDEVYSGIVEQLVLSASEHGEVLYAVPGSPTVGERSVELLRADPRVTTEVLPAVSFADLAFARLGVDPLAAGARIADAHRFAAAVAGHRGPLLVGQCDSAQVLSEVKLAIGAVVDELPGDPPVTVTVLQRLGLDDEHVFTLPWDDLDRAVQADHLTSLWVPQLARSFAAEMVELEELVRALREGCPWDRQQTHQSLTRYLLEESYEALEAIEELGPDGAGYEHLEEELGDVLFQVVFHATLAAEQGQFALADVARNVHDKLVGRHPHVFGDVVARTPEDVARNWEQIKQEERGQVGAMTGVVDILPALLYAHKIQGKAASVGFDWDSAAAATTKLTEEIAELTAAVAVAPLGSATAAVRDELGDLLFAVVNVARHLKVDPEAALRGATAKFRRRFEAVEALAAARGEELRDLSLAEADSLWDEVKSREPGADR
ncbi:MAG TPA: nucleoside triphosphate pyrophosphohydrolase [Acidimicrobiales bacterium]|nr:nucleoside triphosphate pyrophosphohydrolase [Acidimicrobiales bacterium]